MRSDPLTSQTGPTTTAKAAVPRNPCPVPVQTLIDTLTTHRVNTLTELCRIERAAAALSQPSEVLRLRGPMTSAWQYYVVDSSQLLTELRGLTRAFPFSAACLAEAIDRVRRDPVSNRSWNLAWLCLIKLLGDGLIPLFAATEAAGPGMWGDTVPTPESIAQLAGCFEFEWTAAVHRMLRHWTVAPTWY